MAYSTANPPALFANGVGGMARFWIYKSADPIATVNTANYFTNGASLGMKLWDPICVIDTTNGLLDWCVVNAIGNGTTDLSDGLRFTATDTD